MVAHTGDRLNFRRSTTPSSLRRRGPSEPQMCGFSNTYAYTVRPRTTKFGVAVTYMRRGVLGGQPRHCICTNASRGLSATAKFLVRISTGTTVLSRVGRYERCLNPACTLRRANKGLNRLCLLLQNQRRTGELLQQRNNNIIAMCPSDSCRELMFSAIAYRASKFL